MQVRLIVSPFVGIALFLALGASGCSVIEQALVAPVADELHADLPGPGQVVVPVPRGDGEGDYASPFLKSGELAGWAEAALGSVEAASFLGAVRAQNASWLSTGVEVITGEREAVEVNVATLESAGGWENVRASSDVTFDDVDDLAVYLYAKHGTDGRFLRVLKVTQDLNPGLAPAYREAIRRAARGATPGSGAAPKPTKRYSRDLVRTR